MERHKCASETDHTTSDDHEDNADSRCTAVFSLVGLPVPDDQRGGKAPDARGGLPVNDDLVFNLKKFQNGWDAACDDAKISDLRFHDLRATFATRLISRGMPLEEVAKITGHSQVSTAL